MRGRRPTPTALKLVTGNPGRRPLPTTDAEMRPESEIPECPEHLKGHAAKEWARITELLHELDVLAAIDRGALAMVCTLWDRYVTAEEMIERANSASPSSAGLFVKSPNGFAVQSPWLAVSNRAIEQYKGWCSEFGLTPAARVRLTPMTSPQASLFDDGDDEAPAEGTDRFFAK